MLIYLTLFYSVSAGFLEGIGYREQQLQVAKSANFNSETPTGVTWASFGGGTNIFIKGDGLDENPQANTVLLTSKDLTVTIKCPALNEDDTFNSNPMMGFITYRLPSVDSLLGVPSEFLDQYEVMEFSVQIQVQDELSETGFTVLSCLNPNNCMIFFRKSSTATLYSIQPPVVYYESKTAVWFDPHSIPNLLTDLQMDDMPFIYTKVGGALLDFEGHVSFDTSYSQWYRNYALGKVGDNSVFGNQDVKMLWETGFAKPVTGEIMHCSYDNQTCYQAQTVPVIFDLSSNTGYTSGGQNLTVYGHGFDSPNIVATVDGVACQVTSHSKYSFSCEVQQASAPSAIDMPQVGQHGLVHTLVNSTLNQAGDYVWINSVDLAASRVNWTSSKSLYMELETPPYTFGDRYAQKFQAWFEAPETARYRFFMTCDDDCELWVDNTPNQTSNKTRIINVIHAGGFKNYWKNDDGLNRSSEWIDMVKGEHYYLEALHAEGGGGDHLAVAVEIEQSAITGHYHSVREIQELTISVENNKDTTRITVTNADNGEYILNFQDPVSLKYLASNKIRTNATASQFADGVNTPFCQKLYGSWCDVTLQMFDIDGNITTVNNDAVTRVYTMQIRKLISTVSSSNILVAKTSTAATIKVDLPANVQTSSAPLRGSYKIKCIDPEGYESYSKEIPYSQWDNWIGHLTMVGGCDRLYDKIEVIEAGGFPYKDNGVKIWIRFQGLNADPGQFEIVSSDLDPLTGDNLTISFTTKVPYSSNLFYDPVPFEFLKTYHNTPQLIVSVDGRPAVCHNLTCDFSYADPVGEVSSFTFDSATNKVVITGTSLPTQATEIRKVMFALSECIPDAATMTATNLECTLSKEPTCGSFAPSLISVLGVIPNAASVVPLTIGCTVTSVSPASNLNLLGGDNITFVGTNFPHNLETSIVTLVFSDAQSTTCTPQKTSTNELVCLTSKFDITASSGATLTLSLTINGESVSISNSFVMRSEYKSGLTITPSSASPVLKTLLTVTLESTFPETLHKNDFSVNFTSTTNSSIVKRLNVVSVDDSAKTLQVMFGGAESDIFSIGIRHKTQGLLQTAGLLFNVGATVTSISPKVGSIYGGTILTIIGTNFGTQITDNPVQISYNGGVGSTNCFVLTTEATKITCQVDDTIEKQNGLTGTVVVFLRTSEEAVCDNSVCGGYTFIETIPSVTGMASSFDSSLNAWKITVTGTSFPTTTDNSVLMADGVKQSAISASETEAVFKLTSAKSKNPTFKLYFAEGKPANHATIDFGVGISPKLVGITPLSGTAGGTTVIVNAPGVGSEATGLTLLNSLGQSVCIKARVIEYGKIACDTLVQEMTSSVLKISDGVSSFLCEGTDQSVCAYEQLVATASPQIDSGSVSGTTIVFTGVNFLSSGYSVSASYNGIKADTVTVDSATQVTATWNLGVPALSETAATSHTQLNFTEDSTGVTYRSIVSTTIDNQLSVSSSSQSLVCSFGGGCTYEITANGLSNLLKNSENTFISFCENKAVLSAESTDTVAKILLPAVSTAYSDSTFGIQQQRNLVPEKISSSGTSHSKLFDGDLFTQNTDNTAGCYIDMEFKTGYIGVLDKVKYYLAVDRNKQTYYDGHLKFQGSNDGVTFTDIFTADSSAHTGWNYVEWAVEADYPKYKKFRFTGDVAGSCVINEIQLHGIETIDDSAQTFDCAPKLVVKGTEVALSGSVQYQGALTPALVSISPRYGRVEGGDSVTFSGTDFSSTQSDYTIIIDQIPCIVTFATSTSVTCTTGPRPGIIATSLSIHILGKGYVSLKGLRFGYVNMWSSDQTWGGEFAPIEGDSVYVPKGLNLLVDVDSTPLLNAIIVEGTLIFAPNDNDPTHLRTFDARYIMVQEGRMEVGTEEFPYTSKIIITMHGLESDPYLPTYGNKVIGVRMGNLDMHGPVRTPTWTVMETTTEPGATQITLRVAVDWQVGEQISIAPTSFNVDEAEIRFITAIDNSTPDKPVLTLDRPLEFKHFAETQTFGNEQIDMRAEVGLLSRNVVYRGDPETSSKNEYGATIFLHSMGDDSLTARLSYIELRDVGQAFKLGRYAVHFHMIGNVHNSYVKGNSVHDGYNRAFTFHGTSYLRLTDNVVYNVKGHNIFIEDAVERHNQIYRNLVMKTKRSWSLLNTDQTPASFWITNPNNDFVDNHAAGSDRYSYWFDLQEHAMGPSADLNVCPENEPLGMFRNNHAHSNGRYGLRIFHNLMPRTFPCKPVVYDPNNSTDPFWQNPLITANFYNVTSWKNGRNGAIVGTAGDVRFHYFKTADNILAGIEFERTDKSGDGYAQVKDSIVVGKTANTELALEKAEPHGVITPRTENFTLDGVKFYNYNWNKAAALGDCSHCFHPAATDAGARHYTVKNLYIDSTVTKRIRYQFPFYGIFHDLTGELTLKGPNTWAMGHTQHNSAQPECDTDLEVYGGQVCDSTIQVRRIAFSNFKPLLTLQGMQMFILPYDDNILAAQANLTEYELNRENYSLVKFKDKTDPINSWTFPFVTGHKYKIHWANTGVDFTQMGMIRSEKWTETDKNLFLVHNFSDVRALMDVTIGKQFIANGTLPSTDVTDSSMMCGQNMLFNESQRIFQLVINGKNNSYVENREVKVIGQRCNGPCLTDLQLVPTEGTKRYWSNPADWPSGQVPKEGEDVHVEPGWDMVFDLSESPIYKLIRVNGILTFSNLTDTHLHAKHIFIRAGQLHIGSQDYPYPRVAKITLHGKKDETAIVYDNAIEAGNKLIANVGLISMWGRPRVQKMTRLLAPAAKGATSIKVEPGLDLTAGDRIGLAPTAYAYMAADDVFVSSYDNITGIVTLNSSLLHYHWGAAVSTAADYNGVDIRGEVLILSRNIKIAGENIEAWGGQIVTSDTIEGDLTVRSGQTIMHNVEVFNCSQANTLKAALRFEGASISWSHVSNSTFHNGLGWGVNVVSSANVKLENNIVWSFKPIGMGIQTVQNLTLHNNFVGYIYERDLGDTEKFVDRRAGVTICALDPKDQCRDLKITNNIVAGAGYAGFIAPAHDCGDIAQTVFRDNIAHSIDGYKGGIGGIFYPDNAKPSHRTCYEASFFTAYKCTLQGAHGFFESFHAIYSHMTMMDNHKGLGMQINMPGDEQYNPLVMEVNDNMIYGELPIPDCPSKTDGGYCTIFDKIAIHPPAASLQGKTAHIIADSKLPMYKIKSDSAWGGKTKMARNTFIGFKAFTKEGLKNRLFGTSFYQPDYTPMIEFDQTTFIDVEEGAYAYFDDPYPEWANLDDCAQFPCTAPNNILYSFKNSQFTGLKPLQSASEFQLIHDTPGFSQFVQGCTSLDSQNAWFCQRNSLSILHFESQDIDRMDRSSQPIRITLEGTKMNNTLNAEMDHVWDGFYTGQKRQQRFPSIVDAFKESTYSVVYAGTPPKKQLFELNSLTGANTGAVIKIAYPDAVAYQIQINGKYIEMNQWSDVEKNYGPIRRAFCGENRYLAVVNILEFYITPGCSVIVTPRNAIMTKVRMEWTLEEFYQTGGTTTFVDRLAASLGIHVSTIKVVGVYMGSLVIDYNIFTDNDSSQELEVLQEKQTAQIATGALSLGAPIIDFAQNTVPVVTDGIVTAKGYAPVKLTPTATNVNYVIVNSYQELKQIDSAEAKEFKPDITIVEQDVEKLVVSKQVAEQKSMHIIAISLIVLMIIMIAFCMRIVNNFYKKQMIDAEIMKKSSKSLDNTQMNTTTAKKLNETEMITEMEVQYDANQDFAIFAKTTATPKGAEKLSLASKLNFADRNLASFAMTSDASAAKLSSAVPSSSKILEEDREISDE